MSLERPQNSNATGLNCKSTQENPEGVLMKYSRLSRPFEIARICAGFKPKSAYCGVCISLAALGFGRKIWFLHWFMTTSRKGFSGFTKSERFCVERKTAPPREAVSVSHDRNTSEKRGSFVIQASSIGMSVCLAECKRFVISRNKYGNTACRMRLSFSSKCSISKSAKRVLSNRRLSSLASIMLPPEVESTVKYSSAFLTASFSAPSTKAAQKLVIERFSFGHSATRLMPREMMCRCFGASFKLFSSHR